MTTDRAKPLVRYYRLRNRLRNKVGGGENSSAPGELAKESLEQAEQQFEKMAEDYPDWVQSYITKLYEQHGRCVDTPEKRENYFKAINDLAHDLKGQGGTFGYMLISRFGDSLYWATRKRESYEDNHVEIIKAHIDSMRAVIQGRVRGDGGKVGKELIKSLEQAIERYQDVA